MQQAAAFRRFFPVHALALCYVGLESIARMALYARFGAAAEVPLASLSGILLAGIVNDAVECLYLLAPFTLYVALMPDGWYRSVINRRAVRAGFALSIALLVYLAFAEHYFFEEFDARFNVVAFDYLMYPTEVAGDIWAEYPVVLIASVSLAAAFLFLRLGRPLCERGFDVPVPLRERALPAALHVLALLAAVFLYPTDALSFSSNRVANELLQNGHSSFFRAAATSEIDYHAHYVMREPEANLALLAAELGRGSGRFTDLRDGRLDRAFPGRPGGLGRLNVVVVSSESFGAEFSRLYGSAQDLTPNFDARAREGLWFAHTYASGTRTVRGLEALTASLPPIPTVSVLRRPGHERIATWGGVMRGLGYHTSFLYGGYGYFDNMNHFYASNGYEVIDRNSIDEVRFANIWGVSDEDLFDRALEHFDEVHARHEPFFSIVMTTSNHKPFTFRKGLEQYGIPASGGGRAAGVRYADYALGYFLDQARHHPWFDDTLFVVVADHGARVYGKAEIPLRTYRIPLLIYAPQHLAPRRVDRLMTQIDVAPTVLGLLGLPYEAPFFGQDVFAVPAAERLAFFSHNHDVAVYRGGHMVIFGLHKKVSAFAYDEAADRFTPEKVDPALENLGIAYYQTAYELFRTHRYELPGAPHAALAVTRSGASSRGARQGASASLRASGTR